MFKKFTIGLLLAMLTVGGIMALGSPAQAAQFRQSCDYNYNASGAGTRAETCLGITMTAVNGQWRIDEVKINVRNPEGLRDTNSLDIEQVKVTWPAGAVAWERTNALISKNANGVVSKSYFTNFLVNPGGEAYLRSQIFWKDGSYDTDVTTVSLDN